jgi:hypothetical protein
MLSRLVSAWERHHLCSKREAGEWAIGAFGRQWSDVLQMALAEYAANGSAQTAIPSDVVKAFEAYCAERIDRARALAYEAVAGHG